MEEAAAAGAQRGPGREQRQPRQTERRGLGRGPPLPQRPLRPRPEPPTASGRSPSLLPSLPGPRAGAGGRPAGSLTGLRRAAQRSGQAAGAPPAALQQHGRHSCARWAGGRLRPRSCPAARAAAIPRRPAAPGAAFARHRPAAPGTPGAVVRERTVRAVVAVGMASPRGGRGCGSSPQPPEGSGRSCDGAGGCACAGVSFACSPRSPPRREGHGPCPL